MNENMKKTALNFGLIISAVGILFSLTAYVIDEKLFVNPIATILVLVISVVLPFFAIRSYKKLNNGFASFREAFSAFILPVILSLFVNFLFNMLLHNVIDSDLSARQGAMAFEGMMDMPDEQLEATLSIMGLESMDELESEMIKKTKEGASVVGSLKSSATGFIFFCFIGLIAAAVSKKNPPEFE